MMKFLLIMLSHKCYLYKATLHDTYVLTLLGNAPMFFSSPFRKCAVIFLPHDPFSHVKCATWWSISYLSLGFTWPFSWKKRKLTFSYFPPILVRYFHTYHHAVSELIISYIGYIFVCLANLIDFTIKLICFCFYQVIYAWVKNK